MTTAVFLQIENHRVLSPGLRASVVRPGAVATTAAMDRSHAGPLKRNDPGGEIGGCGSPCSGPRCAVALRIRDIRPPFALGSCGRRQGGSKQRFNLLEREHNDRRVAVVQIGIECPILARNVRCNLLYRKNPRCALCNRRGPRPPPDPLEQGRPISHSRNRRLSARVLSPVAATRCAEFIDHSIDVCPAVVAVLTSDTHRRTLTHRIRPGCSELDSRTKNNPLERTLPRMCRGR